MKTKDYIDKLPHEWPDPINVTEWIHFSKLDANAWNPNVVMNKELRLLERLIVKWGWIQPLLVSRDYILIDGFHRWRLAQDSEKLMERYKGLVPISILDADRAEAMMLTVSMNRAKGTHVAVRMSDLVRELVEQEGADPEEVAKGIGANRDEVDLLLTGGLFKSRDFKNYKYSNAWVPIETTRKQKDEAFEREETGEEE